MNGGIIIVTNARGNVHFISPKGDDVLPPMFDVEVKLNREFAGLNLRDAVSDAKSFAAGALKQKVQQKMRGKTCFPVVGNIDIHYRIKYGFARESGLQRELEFKPGDRIIRKGDYGNEFFWLKEGTVEADHVIYRPGAVFGRAAFADCVRKRDVFARTRAKVIAINKDHPDLANRLPVLMKKFTDESKMIRRVRPKARLDRVRL